MQTIHSHHIPSFSIGAYDTCLSSPYLFLSFSIPLSHRWLWEPRHVPFVLLILLSVKGPRPVLHIQVEAEWQTRLPRFFIYKEQKQHLLSVRASAIVHTIRQKERQRAHWSVISTSSPLTYAAIATEMIVFVFIVHALHSPVTVTMRH